MYNMYGDLSRLMKADKGCKLPADVTVSKAYYNRWARKPGSGTRKPVPSFMGFHRMITSNCLPPKRPVLEENSHSAPVGACRRRRDHILSAHSDRPTRIPPLPEITVNFVEGVEGSQSQGSPRRDTEKHSLCSDEVRCPEVQSMPSLLFVPHKNLIPKATRSIPDASNSLSSKISEECAAEEKKARCDNKETDDGNDTNRLTDTLVLPSITKSKWTVADSEVTSLKEDVNLLFACELTMNVATPEIMVSAVKDSSNKNSDVSDTLSTDWKASSRSMRHETDKTTAPHASRATTCRRRAGSDSLSVLGHRATSPFPSESIKSFDSDQLLNIRSYGYSHDPTEDLPVRDSDLALLRQRKPDVTDVNNNCATSSELKPKGCTNCDKLCPPSSPRHSREQCISRLSVEGYLSRALKNVLGDPKTDKILKDSLEMLAIIGTEPRISTRQVLVHSKSFQTASTDDDSLAVKNNISAMDKHFKTLVKQFNRRARNVNGLRRSASTSNSRAHGGSKRSHCSLAELCSVGEAFPDPNFLRDDSVHLAASLRLHSRFSYKDYGPEM